MIRLLTKIWAFLVRDFLSDVSYRFAFLLQLGGMFFAVAMFYFASRMINPATEGLDGVAPFPWLLVGIAFQLYFSTALYAFSAKVRSEQVLGTLEQHPREVDADTVERETIECEHGSTSMRVDTRMGAQRTRTHQKS